MMNMKNTPNRQHPEDISQHTSPESDNIRQVEQTPDDINSPVNEQPPAIEKSDEEKGREMLAFLQLLLEELRKDEAPK